MFRGFSCIQTKPVAVPVSRDGFVLVLVACAVCTGMGENRVYGHQATIPVSRCASKSEHGFRQRFAGACYGVVPVFHRVCGT